MQTVREGLDTVRVGLYWDLQLWDDARAAFVSDQAHLPGAPAAFIGWLHLALERHAALGVQQRAALELDVPRRRGRGQGQGKSRMSPLTVRTLELVDEAVAADLEQLGKTRSRSAFVQEAVAAAVAASRVRRPGSNLPPAPATLDKNPHRRRPLRRHAAAGGAQRSSGGAG